MRTFSGFVLFWYDLTYEHVVTPYVCICDFIMFVASAWMNQAAPVCLQFYCTWSWYRKVLKMKLLPMKIRERYKKSILHSVAHAAEKSHKEEFIKCVLLKNTKLILLGVKPTSDQSHKMSLFSSRPDCVNVFTVYKCSFKSSKQCSLHPYDHSHI